MKVRMLETVRSEIPFPPFPKAYRDKIYEARTNAYGAVSVLTAEREWLGVKPGEFEIIEE